MMTVVWHIDDLKVSHKDPFEVTKFFTYFSNINWKKRTVHRVKVHDYFGMHLDYSELVVVKV